MSRRTVKSENRSPKAERRSRAEVRSCEPCRRLGSGTSASAVASWCSSEDILPKVPCSRSARRPLRVSGFGLLSAFGLRPSEFTRMALLFWALLLGASILTGRAKDFPSITLQQAHESALRYHPEISVADLRVLVARQTTRQVQAGFWPNLSANVMSVGAANDNTRLAAIGGLNNPLIFDRNAEGLILSQLITDFGRTPNLASSAKRPASKSCWPWTAPSSTRSRRRRSWPSLSSRWPRGRYSRTRSRPKPPIS